MQLFVAYDKRLNMRLTVERRANALLRHRAFEASHRLCAATGGGGRPATLIESADLVERGRSLPQELDEAIWHGISIGGARPKAQVTDGNRKMIAKFSASKDQHSVLKSEYIAMKIAQACRRA